MDIKKLHNIGNQHMLRTYPIRLFYLPFCIWAVFTILTYSMYAPVVARCLCYNNICLLG
ncbi:MAG: hypothetical protein N6V49_00070 [Serratia symbiotica]|nr:hypothetical protein [Serratia symbiotica]